MIWGAAILLIASAVAPWATKEVREDAWDSIGPAEASYHIGTIRVEWLTSDVFDASSGERVRTYDYDYLRYTERAPDFNLPSGSLMATTGDGVVCVAVGMLLAASLHGARPGPRRRRFGAWLVALVGIGAALNGLLFLLAIGLHAAGWRAQQVGPLIPFFGAWAWVGAITLLAMAVRRIGLRRAEPFEMPCIPTPAQPAPSGPPVEWNRAH